MIRSLVLALGLVVALVGCASITAELIDPVTGARVSGADDGLIYYPPRPYLLVATSPVDASHIVKPTGQHPSQDPVIDSAQGGSADRPASASTTADKPMPGDSGEDTFQLAGSNYLFKLIYLPDLAHPRVLKVSGGLFGKISLQPQLKDGWMLTGLQSTADSSAAAQMISSILSAKFGGGASKGDTSAKSAMLVSPAAENKQPALRALAPGLYRIDFDSSGQVNGISAVEVFCSDGSIETSLDKCKATW